MRQPAPTLSLCIPVYNGGKLWNECWKRVLPLAEMFDQIVVGFNKSNLQDEDAQVVSMDSPSNVKTLFQQELLTPSLHLAALVEVIDTDFVLFLCHDDYLLAEGVEELRKLIEKKAGVQCAFFGSHQWGRNEEFYSGITRELLLYPDGIDAEQFIISDMDHAYSFSLSGLVGPVSSLQRNVKKIRLFEKGFRLDNFMVTAPGVEKILQSSVPIVEICIHPDQAGRQVEKRARVLDNISFYFIHAMCGKDERLVRRCIEKIVFMALHARRVFVFGFIFKLMLSSLTWTEDKNTWKCVKYAFLAIVDIFHLILKRVISKATLFRHEAS